MWMFNILHALCIFKKCTCSNILYALCILLLNKCTCTNLSKKKECTCSNRKKAIYWFDVLLEKKKNWRGGGGRWLQNNWNYTQAIITLLFYFPFFFISTKGLKHCNASLKILVQLKLELHNGSISFQPI